tara:strand:+ start:327 stop:710 length:384 start_codon:yes stop_codon:yes gene_type:complete
MKTKEELKKARAISDTKYRANNKDKIKESNAKWLSKNKKYHIERRLNTTTHFTVYKHTNSKGDVYIGSGNNLRPYNFVNRSKSWIEAFKNDCTVSIVSEFKDRECARELEALMISEIGLKNLININK